MKRAPAALPAARRGGGSGGTGRFPRLISGTHRVVTSALGSRIRDWWRFAFASTAARSRASRDILAARSELARLREEFRRTQLELGGAAYREDAAETERLRARMRELQERARTVGRGTHRAAGEAERQIGEERLAIQPTEIVPPAE